MKKKIICIGIISMFLLTGLTTVSALQTKTVGSNGEDSIQVIVKAEQGDGDRTWNIKFYVKNTVDEDITIRTGPLSAISWIERDPNDQEEHVYFRYGPSGKPWKAYPIPSYPYIKTLPSNEEILMDEYTFHGKSNVPSFLRKGADRILPEGDYYVSGRFMYKHLLSTQTENVFSESSVTISLGEPPEAKTRNLPFLKLLADRFPFLNIFI